MLIAYWADFLAKCLVFIGVVIFVVTFETQRLKPGTDY